MQMPDNMEKQMTATVIRKCPVCGKAQRPYIASVTPGGLYGRLRCKHCGAVDTYEKWHTWNKGVSKYASDDERNAAMNRQRRAWDAANPEKAREIKRRVNASDAAKASRRRYYERNKDAVNAQVKRWRHDNREAYNAWQRDWYRANRARLKASALRCYRKMADDLSDRRHGTPYGYKLGCRCDRCREAKRREREGAR